MKKRLISLLLAFSMMLTFLPAGAVSAFAEENSHTYNCGENVTATLSRNSDGEETYTLTIKGNGPMANYNGYKLHLMIHALRGVRKYRISHGLSLGMA